MADKHRIEVRPVLVSHDPAASRYHIDIIHSLRRKHKAQQEHIKELQAALTERNEQIANLTAVGKRLDLLTLSQAAEIEDLKADITNALRTIGEYVQAEKANAAKVAELEEYRVGVQAWLAEAVKALDAREGKAQ